MDNAAEKNTAEAGAKARSAEDFSEWNSTSFPTVNPALQAYLRELGKLPRFSLDEQVALGERILAAENRWRELLAAFGSAAQWQTDFLNCKDQEFWSEQFIPSVPISELEPEKLIRYLKKCENTAALLYDSFVRGDLQETGQLRQKMIAELNLYKLSSDVVRQFHEELLLTAETLPDEALTIVAAESAYSINDFKKALTQADKAWNELLELRQQMVEGNLRLVVRIANQYSYRNVSVSDLVQEGNLGLMRSLEKFDFNLKHKFSTYASWWIRQSISRAVAEQFRVIRIPAHMVSTIAAINRVEQRFILEHDRLPEVSEIAALLEMPPARISAIRKMARQTISLQSPLTADASGGNLEDILPDEQASDPTRAVADETMNKQLLELLKMLSSRERAILTMRFGLMGKKVHTLQEISEYFNISRERVRQLEMQTLNKLRTPEILRMLGAYRS